MTMQQTQVGLEWNNCAAESAADETLKINFLTTFERKLAHCQFWKGRFFVTYLSKNIPDDSITDYTKERS